jgi:GT2 family glycosyltransferase
MPKQIKQFLIEELVAQYNAKPDTKDIIIIVHDQLQYVEKCLSSVFKNTQKPFTVYVWDNGSNKETQEYLSSFPNIKLTRSEDNIGFIVPNNRLMAQSTGNYKILLNSDCEVLEGWDQAMIGYLQTNPSVSVVGYQGGLLNEDGIGIGSHHGDEIDYIIGWSMCFEKKIWEKYGLFDETNLQFAYGEDSDFSLRLREAGEIIYALNLSLVTHHAHKTTASVKSEMDLKPSFTGNHHYLRQRWKSYLGKHRVLLNYPELESQILDAWKSKHSSDLTIESLVQECFN